MMVCVPLGMLLTVAVCSEYFSRSTQGEFVIAVDTGRSCNSHCLLAGITARQALKSARVVHQTLKLIQVQQNN